MIRERPLPIVLRVMRCALVLLPARFRDRYGDELVSVARDRWRESARPDRYLAGAALIGDLVLTALRMRAAQGFALLDCIRHGIAARPIARVTALALLVVGSTSGLAWRLGWCPYDTAAVLHQRMIEERGHPPERAVDRRAGATVRTHSGAGGDGAHGA